MNKKIIVFLEVMLLSVSFLTIVKSSNNTCNQLIVKYSFEQPIIHEIEKDGNIFNQVIINGSPCFDDPGEPSLPIKGSYILLPQGTEVNEISISYNKKEYLGSGFNVEPVSFPISKFKNDTKLMRHKKENINNSHDIFPKSLFSEVGTYIFRGYNIVVLAIYPVQYNPFNGNLFFYPNLTVIIETKRIENTNSLFRGIEPDRIKVMKKVDNPEMAFNYQKTELFSNSCEQYDYLIITKDSLKDDFQYLKMYHENNGVRTVIKTLNDIGGIGTPEDIREYIRNAYTDWGIEYVLIGGDEDIVPAKMLWQSGTEWNIFFYDEYFPSDLYYACLDGTYNYDGDEKWGESTDGENGGDVDLFAEVYVGRACVGDVNEVDNFIHKTLSYLNTDFESDDYLNEVLMAGSYIGDFDGRIAPWGGDYLDLLIDIKTVDGYTTSGIPSKNFDIIKLYDRYDNESIWEYESLDLSDYVGYNTTQIRFRLKSDDSENYYGFHFDDFEIFGDGIQIFFDDMENGEDGWVHGGENDQWELGQLNYSECDFLPFFAYSGENCWGTDIDSNYADYCNQYLISPQFDLSDKSTAELCFYMIVDIEENENADQCYVEIRRSPSDQWMKLATYWHRANFLVGWDTNDIVSIINNNVHVINHAGHSTPHQNMKIGSEDSLTLLTNSKYFFAYSWGCHAGAFDNLEGDDCIAEYLTVKTKHGAFAGIWSARGGMHSNFGTDADGFRFRREFWDAVYGEYIPVISQANQDSKEDNVYLINRTLMRLTYYQLNFFGDPVVSFNINYNPIQPEIPSGQTNGKVGEEYTYSTSTTDPDGDQVYYKWYWNDKINETSDWIGPYNSGDTVTASHIWDEKGDYIIKVKAKDVHGEESEWSDPLPITMPKNKAINPFILFLERLMERFPILEQILQPIYDKLTGF